jgi:uncharacterized protein YndB with AHSA1/START domain
MEHRFITKSATLEKSVGEVWNLWTTKSGLESFFAPNCNFKLEIGGPFEMLFDGEQKAGLQGSEGCQIMAIEPNSMLSFSWNAPPHIPTIREQKTFVEVHFIKVGNDSTRVTLRHHGWGINEEWTKTFNYFENAWNYVFSNLEKVCN